MDIGASEPQASTELPGAGESLVDHSVTPPEITADAEPMPQTTEAVQPEPALAEAEPVPAAPGAGNDDSVEDYMRKLLARMRGVPEEDVEMPAVAQPTAPAPVAASDHAGSAPADPSLQPVADGSAESVPGDPAAQTFDPESYVPRVAAPEKSSKPGCHARAC